MQAQIREWGNSQGIRLPKEILKSAGMALNEIIDITVSEGVITIKKNFHIRPWRSVRHNTVESLSWMENLIGASR